jgi:hypothetical protein
MRSKRRAFAWGQTFHLHLLRKNRGPVGVTYFSCFSEIPRNSLTKKTFTITEANKIARVAASNVHKVWINTSLVIFISYGPFQAHKRTRSFTQQAPLRVIYQGAHGRVSSLMLGSRNQFRRWCLRWSSPIQGSYPLRSLQRQCRRNSPWLRSEHTQSRWHHHYHQALCDTVLKCRCSR